jgi:ATP-dependent Lhr-like helicase
LARPSLPDTFHDPTREWFADSFPAGPTRAQSLGWPEILSGHSALIFAPTGSGKTLAAFLAAIDRLMFAPVPEKAARCRVVYISPMRALAVDVERNLRAPLAGIGRVAEQRGIAFHAPTVSVRTGDTPASERARLNRQPADVLITTPESLFLVLTSEAHRMLVSTEVVIVDEIHALVGTKRGAHLALSLERLSEIARKPPQRLGLSATQRPLEEVARFLGGGRRVHIVDAGAKKVFDLKVEVPVEDMSRLGQVLETDPLAAEPLEMPEGDAGAVKRRSIWPAIHPRLLELIRGHRSTILFVNSRRLAERLAGALNELAGEDLVRAHHGSIAREERVLIEDALKTGQLRAMVATSSLELGIDMGAVDLVVQIETPPSVASGIQRIGRAGHQAGAVSRGVIFPKYRGDLLATAAITRAIQHGDVETTRVPANPLDVLAQQLVAIVAMGERTVDDLFTLVRHAAPFAKLPRTQFEGVLDMLSGRYPSDEFAELRPRVTWDRLRGTVRAREGAKRLAIANAGTIPDRGLFGVFLAGDENRGARRVGELDEEMVFESGVGDVFVLGASSWRIAEITRDRVFVVPAPGQGGQMPFWRGDRTFRPVDLGVAIGRLTRELLAATPAKAVARLVSEHALDALAAANLMAYLQDQKAATGAVPDDRTLVLERTRDEMGDWRLCLLSPFGGRVHAPLALAIEARLLAAGEPEVDAIWSDDGIVVRLPDRERLPDAAALLPAPEEIEDLVVSALGGSAMFAGHFREAAARALLLPRRRPGLRTPLWMQRKRAHDLLAVASRYGSFPIILEAYRECLQDVFDLPGLVDLARRIARREVRLTTVDTRSPSPFAAALLFGYVANYLYEGDAPLAERRAQALSVDQSQLRELLGEAELRELLDPKALEDTALALQGLTETTKARNADRLHDLLLRIGDLSLGEMASRCEPETAASDWLAALSREGRVVRVQLAQEERVVAVEDMGRFRDALGLRPPAGLPAAFLEPVPQPVEGLVARYARSHAPFRAVEVARRLALGEGAVELALRRLADAGRVLEGEFRPGGQGREWCDPAVLATIRRRSLAALRQQVEPAEPEALGRLLVDWQGVVSGESAPRGGADALLDVIEQLQGVAIPASILESEVLPARLPEYRPSDLDALCSAGEVVWAGLGTLGERDGRVSLYLAEDLPLLHQPGEPPALELHATLRDYLGRSGASFFDALHGAAGGGLTRPTLDALWDLVWAGEVTNDSPAALRSFLRAHASRSRDRRFRPLAPFRSRRAAPASASGRWSLLPSSPATATQRIAARAEQLLARHGIVTRDAVAAEGLPGGFAALYPVLAALEEAGRIRRGYFVRGLGGSQFAHPGALERLRALREAPVPEAASVLAAPDPANPYGAALPWPAHADARPQRAAGAHVFLWGGALVASLARGERELSLFLPPDEPQRSAALKAIAQGLAAWATRTGRTFFGDTSADGLPLGRSLLAPHLASAGFVPAGGGFRRT